MTIAADDEKFRRDFEPHRRAITLHCYRMLGSLQDAEEVAQEALTRAWQRLDQLRSGQATKAWLYQIATNACLDVLKTRRRRRTLPFMVGSAADPQESFGPPAEDGVWIEPAPDSLLERSDDESRHLPDARVSMRESIALAFITALQLLAPKQRAALLLVDVLGWKPQEAADLLKTTIASVNSLLQRARRAVDTRDADPDRDPTGAVEDESLLRRYIATWQGGDLDAFAALLAEDAILSMPPHPEWYTGREAIKQFFTRLLAAAPRRYRMLPTRANGSPAIAFYVSIAGGPFEPSAIAVLSFRGGYVARITRFDSPHLFPLFGLPASAPQAPGTRSD